MEELLDSMHTRALAKFKASDAANVLEATNLTTMQLHALSNATVETISEGTPININLPEQYGGIKADIRVQFWGSYTTPLEQVDATNLIFTLKTGEFLYILDPRVDMTKGKVYIASHNTATES